MAKAAPQEIEETSEGSSKSTLLIGLGLVIVLAIAGYVLFAKSSTTGPPPTVKPTTPTTPIPGAGAAAVGALTSPGFFSGLTNLASQIAADVKPGAAGSGNVDAVADPNSPTGYVDSGGSPVNQDGSDYTGSSTYVNLAVANFGKKQGY